MEEIFQQIDKILETTADSRKNLADNFEIFKSKLDAIVYGTIEPCLTPQQKKKVKRLSVIVDTEESECNGDTLMTSQIGEVVIKNEIIETSSTSFARPSRAAKLKVSSFKEPSLTEKLRRPTQADESRLRNITQIEEGPTKEENISKSSSEKSSHKNNIPSKRPLEDEKENVEEDDSDESPKKVDDSLLIVPGADVVVLEISDTDTGKLMPPPADIPKKKTTRKPKQSETSSDTSSETSIRSSRLRIKQEKLSINDSSQKNKNSKTTKEVPENVEDTVDEIKKEKSDEDENSTVKRGKSKRGKKPFKHLPIKEEADSHVNVEASEKTSSSEVRVTRSKDKCRPTSTESVYEDAVSNAAPLVPEKPKLASNGKTTETDRVSKEMAGDATFVSAKDIPINENNATFVASGCPQQTFVMEKGHDHENNAVDADRTHVILSNIPASAPGDTTFNINNQTFKTQPTEQQQYSDVLQSSIMTEEDSTDEIMAPPAAIQRPVLTKANQKKELFNPCIQSPVKKKVEAFEKHASALASPAELRQTRNKTKAKENKDPEHITPLLKRDIAKYNTPIQSYITPTIGMANTKYLANSTSKLAQLQKSAKAQTSIAKTHSLSRENSAEDVKRAGYNSKLQQLADEKKKKREQKQQQAALAREARERERTDKLKKAMQEREDKIRRKAQDLEMKKQLEDIHKNIKLQEEKREVQKKLDKKQLEQELAEAARKEREMLDNLKIQRAKEELQQKLMENQRLLPETKIAKKAKDTLKYDFDQLNSGDSTDEEGKPSKKRPPPPVWSKSNIRQMLTERQTQMPTIVIDSFFSVQPMTPDLKEIFPAIDPRYLKRNSSMYWNTPPKC